MIELAPTPAAPAFTQRDEARMRQAAEKAQGAQQALETLKGMRARPNEDLKARAREKLDGLKERLQQLSMLGASPRQLAEIARELSATVKDYGGAAGKPTQTDGASALSPADDAFLTDARKLARQLRESAAEAERRAWLTGDTSDATQATRATKAAEEAIDKTEREMRQGAGALDLSV